MNLPQIHERALGATGKLVDGVTADQLDLPTPCDGWSVRELLNHIVGGNLWAAELAAGKTIAEVGDRLDGDTLGDDPQAAYRASAKLAAAAFNAPARWTHRARCRTDRYRVRCTAVTASSTSRSTVGTWPRPPVRTRPSIPSSSTPSPRSSRRRSTCSRAAACSARPSGSRADADAQTRLLSQLGRSRLTTATPTAVVATSVVITPPGRVARKQPVSTRTKPPIVAAVIFSSSTIAPSTTATAGIHERDQRRAPGRPRRSARRTR